ncbi:MAG: hypothetical protein AAGM67_15470, partial [Bacteroidota bacterium]
TRNWREYRLDIHADVLKIKAHEATTGLSLPPVGGGKRGAIRGFSRQSRKRMIEFMACTRTRGQLLFSTFTYPANFPVGQPDVWIDHFEALRRRIERKYPNYSIIWRKELKPKLSGSTRGKLCPHYHMIIDTGVSGKPDITVEHVFNRGEIKEKCVSALSEEFEAWALQNWYEIVGSEDEYHLQRGNFTVACRNKRHAYKYVSKYVAKVDFDEYEVGRRWGRIGQWDVSSSGSLFLTQKEYIELMRLVVRWMKSKGQDYAKHLAKMKRSVGCTLFGLGDLARSGDLYQRMINHASQLAGELPQIE